MCESTSEDPIEKMQNGLIEALRTAAVDAPAWHLTSADRWRLLRDTLLGHVRVRGKLRPRDLPLDTSCQAVIDSAAAILNLRPYTFEQGTLRFRHWLAIFSLLPLATTEACEKTPLSADDLLCATILELCFAIRGGVTQDLAGQAASPFVQRLIGVLGLSQQEWNSLVDRYKKAIRERDPAHDAVLARRAAQVIGLSAPPNPADFQSRAEFRSAVARDLPEHPGQLPSIEKALAALDERACCYVTLKAEKPQRYINRGTRHWLLRGASGWCSQSLALARDLMCDFKDALLFSDSDAVVGMWFPRTAPQKDLDNELEQKLRDFWQLNKPGEMDKRFPRLCEWLRNNHAGDQLDRATNLPTLKPWCMQPLSVLEICLYRIPKDDSDKPADDDETSEDGSCSRVIGDKAVGFKTPAPWLQGEDGDDKDNADGKDGDDAKTGCVGITSMIWALCGTAFRTHAHEGLCNALGVTNRRLQAVKHGDWLQQLGMSKESLVHLKIDGDGVGERFRTSSLADFPWLSMQLGRMVQQRLVAGVGEAIKRCPSVGGVDVPTLPIDVVYVGGDDVYVILPELVLSPFLDGFAQPQETLAGNPWKQAAFTFIAAKLKPRANLLAGLDAEKGSAGSPTSERFAAANLAAARLVTEGLKPVKKDFKGEATLDQRAIESIQSMLDRALKDSKLFSHRMMATAVPDALHHGPCCGDGRHLLRGRIFEVGPAPSSG